MKMRKKKHIKRIKIFYSNWYDWSREFRYYDPLLCSPQDAVDNIDALIKSIRENHPEAFEWKERHGNKET